MKNSNKKYSILENKLWRIFLLFVAGVFGIMLHYMSRSYLTCLLHEDSLPYFRTLVTGIPVFGLLWFFRTHDTQAQLAKTDEQIKQNGYFNGLENLTSSDPLKIDVGVDQLKRLSKTNSEFNDDIKLAFIKRLKACPLDFSPESKNQHKRLTYAQWILSWLVDNYSIAKLDLNGCDFTNQNFELTDFQFAKIFSNNGKNKTESITFKNASLQKADLTGADLTGADLTDTNLRGADLTDADLASADLSDANLTGATLTAKKLLGAIANNNTKGLEEFQIRIDEKSRIIACSVR